MLRTQRSQVGSWAALWRGAPSGQSCGAASSQQAAPSVGRDAAGTAQGLLAVFLISYTLVGLLIINYGTHYHLRYS